jgi:hypothetical protein
MPAAHSVVDFTERQSRSVFFWRLAAHHSGAGMRKAERVDIFVPLATDM